jgi:hypothetical protein
VEDREREGRERRKLWKRVSGGERGRTVVKNARHNTTSSNPHLNLNLPNYEEEK